MASFLTSVSSNLNIFSDAAIPLVATWKKEPKSLSGIKNSEDNRIIITAPPTLIFPKDNSFTAISIPKAAPPKAIKSIIVIELNCIVKTFIVTFLNVSASLFISSFFSSSKSNIFKVVNP